MSCFVAFHYRSYGTFFLQQNRLHNIHRDLPTTNIIEPKKIFKKIGQNWSNLLTNTDQSDILRT